MKASFGCWALRRAIATSSPHVQVRHANDHVDATLLQRRIASLGHILVVAVDVDVVAVIAAIVSVQGQRKDANRLITVAKREPGLERRIGCGVARLEA